MTVLMLRHAQTAGNLAHHYLGRTDAPLCPEGIAHAQACPADETVQTVYTSGLARTSQTAGILYPNARQRPVPGLNEMDFGLFEGKSWRQMENLPEYRAWVDGGCVGACPGGEDREGFTARCVAAFEELLKEEQKAGAARVHMVVHGGTIMALLSALATPAGDYFSWKPGFCGGYLLSVTKDAGRPLALLATIND